MTRTPRRLLVLSLLALPIFAAACGGGEGGSAGAAADPALVARGERVFMQTCATCHGQDAMGLPNLGKSLHANEFVQTHDDAAMVEFIKTGRPMSDPLNTTGIDMPPRGGNPALTDDDLKAVVAYLRTLQ